MTMDQVSIGGASAPLPSGESVHRASDQLFFPVKSFWIILLDPKHLWNRIEKQELGIVHCFPPTIFERIMGWY